MFLKNETYTHHVLYKHLSYYLLFHLVYIKQHKRKS